MRPITKGHAPLDSENHARMLNEHIPYRMSLLRDGLRPPWISPCQHTNQAFEAGSVSGRILLSFIGLGCDRETGELKPTTKHDSKEGMTDDVKAPDVGGRFADFHKLSAPEKEVLAKFIRGTHKACAHFTVGSDHELTVETYQQAVPIIQRLLQACLPQI